MTTRRGFLGLLGGIAALPVVGRLIPAAAALNAVPKFVTVEEIYGRGPMTYVLRTKLPPMSWRQLIHADARFPDLLWRSEDE